MSEPGKSQRQVRIVEAAGKLFALQGYHATSTREVAHLADVGENTIFRHFNSKEGLFWATLDAHLADLEFPKDVREGLERYEPPEIVVPKILGLFSDTADFKPELLRLLAVASVELQAKTETFYRRRLSAFLSVINSYLEMNIKCGKIRNLDPTMLTTALVMTALTHTRIYSLIDGDKPSYPNRLKEKRARTAFWLEVLAPQLHKNLIPDPGQSCEESRLEYVASLSPI